MSDDPSESLNDIAISKHSRNNFSRELLMRQQRMLLNSGTSSGVIVGGSGAVSKGAVKDFAHSQQQAAKAVQVCTKFLLSNVSANGDSPFPATSNVVTGCASASTTASPTAAAQESHRYTTTDWRFETGWC